MPVPNQISDLDVVAANNSPPGTESAKGNIDNYLRAAFAFIKQTNNLTAGATATLASASTVAIGAAAVNNITISGSATISAFDTVAEGSLRFVTFSGAATLTHNATSLILPGAANIVTAAGDSAIFKSLGSGNWQCLFFQRASGAIVAPSATLTGALAAATGAFSSGLTAPTPATGNRSTSVATTQMFANEFAALLPGSSSWQKFPSGLVMQYGAAGTAANGFVRVGFPIAFPTATTAVFCTGNGSDFTNMTFQVVGLTTTTVDVRSATGGNTPLSVSFNWIAFGY